MTRDWDPAAYGRFADLRLRPALDLMAAVPTLPPGDIIDLGCGAGATGPALAARWPGRRLIGVDASPAMLEKARATGAYAELVLADAAEWVPVAPPALIFSNALLHWLSDHETLVPRLAGMIAAGGTLAVQVPGQNGAPSHLLWRQLAGADVAARSGPGILEPAQYLRLLAPLGRPDVWETTYFQRLPASDQGHPVRRFTESTYARPFLADLDPAARASRVAAYDDAVARAYPAEPDGTVLFPFRRVFLTLIRAA